jgi:hypothetical protein
MNGMASSNKLGERMFNNSQFGRVQIIVMQGANVG